MHDTTDIQEEIQFSLSSRIWLSATPWTAACQASLSITNSQSCSNSCPSVMPSNHLILCLPLLLLPSIFPFFSCLQSSPASGSFPRSQLFASGGQRIGASASTSVLPINIQRWFSLGLTFFRIDLFDLLAVQGTLKSLLQHPVQKHQFFGTQPSWWSSSHIHTWLLETPWHWLYWPLSAKWWLCFLIHCLGLSSLFF